MVTKFDSRTPLAAVEITRAAGELASDRVGVAKYLLERTDLTAQLAEHLAERHESGP